MASIVVKFNKESDRIVRLIMAKSDLKKSDAVNYIIEEYGRKCKHGILKN